MGASKTSTGEEILIGTIVVNRPFGSSGVLPNVESATTLQPILQLSLHPQHPQLRHLKNQEDEEDDEVDWDDDELDEVADAVTEADAAPAEDAVMAEAVPAPEAMPTPRIRFVFRGTRP